MNKKTSPRFAVTAGDPAGIGMEVTLKALRKLPRKITRRLVIMGTKGALETAEKITGIQLRMVPFMENRLPSADETVFIDRPGFPRRTIAPGRISKTSGLVAARQILGAVELCADKTVAGIITAPIHKKALNSAGFRYAGHTEMLAELSGTKKVAMMLSSPEMNVVVLTTHLPLKSAVREVKKELVLEKIVLISDCLRPDKPIGVCGLNPHASDGGLFGDEEKLEILPAIKEAQRMKIDARGPFPADTIFAPRIRQQYGAILAMYHDQGLGPIKATGFGNCANITLGLPFIRTSVDHGTALEIAGKGIADPSSMIYAIKTAFRIYSRL